MRYLTDAAGKPFAVRGRTAWYVLSRSTTDYTKFLDDTLSKGFNAIEIKGITHDSSANNAPFAGNGAAPFTQRLDGSSWTGSLSYSSIGAEAPDFTTPNEAYWSFVDAFLDACEARGIVVLMFPAYVGFAGGSQGWMQEMAANGAAKMQSYGMWIANRYKARRNLIWMIGGDYSGFSPAQQIVEQAMINGLKGISGQSSTLYSAEWESNSVATDQSDFGSQVNFNGAYSWTGQTASYGRKAYSFASTMPAFLLEEPYDEEGPDGNGFNPNATQPVRRFVYWGVLSSIGGYMAGNGYVWPFKTGWASHLNTAGTNDLKRLNDFLQSIDWWRLVPEGLGGIGTLVTAGGGTIDRGNYVAAAATTDSDLLVAYIGPSHVGGVTIEMSKMRGTVTARWFDPTNGAYTTIGTYPNTGTRTFTPSGDNSAGAADWVLRLDA